jgi:hypothetical protein
VNGRFLNGIYQGNKHKQMMKVKRVIIRLLQTVLLLLVVAIGLLVVSLHRGINVDSLSLGSLRIERLSASLDGKLSLDVGRIAVAPDPSAPPSSAPDLSQVIKPSRVRDLLHGVHFLARAFKHITIEHIEVGSLNANFSYRERGEGHFNAHSARVDIALGIRVEGDQLVVDITQLQAPDFGVQGTGTVHLDPAKRELRASLEAVIADTLPVALELTADSEQLSFQGHGLAPVASLAPIIAPFKLGPAITPWIVDYLRGSAFTLSEVSGSLPYSDPATILQTLHAVAHVKDVAYTFDQALDPVLADEVKVVFEQGLLHIYPQATTFYGQDGGSSYVDLNFNDQRFAVLVYVRTLAQLSPGINTVLAHYNVHLPFEQVAGQTDTDLTLTIDINPAPVTVHTDGHFVTTDSELQMGKQRYQLAAMDIALKDSRITFKQLDLGLDERLALSATGEIDFSSRQGDLDIVLDRFAWPIHDTALALQSSPEQPAVFHYRMDPDGDNIVVPATRWAYGDLPLAVAAFTTPFDLSAVSGDLSAVAVTVGHSLQGRVSGEYRSRAPFADLHIDLHHLDVAGLQLAQPAARIDVQVGSAVDVSTSSALQLSAKGLPIALQPSRLQYAGGVLQIRQSALQVGAGLTTELQGEWSVAQGEGLLSLHDFKISDKSGAALFVADQDLSLQLSRIEGTMRLALPQLALDFGQSVAAGWTLHAHDIRLLHQLSPLLQRLGLDGGQLSLASPPGSAAYTMDGRLHLAYPLLVQGDTPIHDYPFTGSHHDKVTRLTFNEHFEVELAKTVQIDSTGFGFNLPALLDLANQLSGSKPETTVQSDGNVNSPASVNATAMAEPGKATESVLTSEQAPDQPTLTGPRVRLNARDSFLWLAEKRRAPASNLLVHYVDGKVTGDLQYKTGYATLEWADGTLNMAGHGFDHTFINDLLHIVQFDKGTLEFGAQGSPEDLIAALRVRNTVIIDYKDLNNVLAFIDTVPALLTFKAPHYDTQGLPVKEIYTKIGYQNNVVDLESLHIDSDELMVNGSGTVDLGQQTTDMTFNVITGAKTSIQRIPLLGYILAGGENKPSITVTVKGDVHHPDVKQTAFKEVVTYPFELIKRTILLPDHMVKKAKAGKDQTPSIDESIPD